VFIRGLLATRAPSSRAWLNASAVGLSGDAAVTGRIATAALAGAVVLAPVAAVAAPGGMVRADPSANAGAYTPAISADGRWVVFASDASNLVPGDYNHRRDIFLRDLSDGSITRVSVSSKGQQANSDSFNPSISADGRYIVYDSFASNLVPDDDNGEGDVFLYDRLARTTTLVTRGTAGKAGAGQSGFATISADGNTVVFESTARDLLAGVDSPSGQVYAWDRRTSVFELVTVGWAGGAAGGGSGGVSVSADGRYVAFASGSAGLVPNDYNQASDVFVRDRKLHSTVRVSVNSNGGEGNGKSDAPSISADGQRVAFESTATNLLGTNPTAQNAPRVPRSLDPSGTLEGGDNNFASDIFVHDLGTGRTRRVSVATAGTEANGDSYGAAISGDGRYVAFVSVATNLVAGDTNRTREVFVHDIGNGATSRVCADGAAARCDRLSTTASVDKDGGRIVFASAGSDVVSDDANHEAEILVRSFG
jgi:Tol biopolymer transport system component